MRSPLAPVLALVLVPFALGCHSSGDISTAKGVPGKPTSSSGGLGNLGGGNDLPDGHVDPDSGFISWTDASTPDGATGNQEGQCAGETQAAQQVPLELLLLIDRSGSMTDAAPGGKTKWEMAQAALTSFVQDPKSAGLGVGLQYFPVVVPCAVESDCGFPAGTTAMPACFEEHACVGATGTLTGLPRLCGARREGPCPDGTTCQPIGRCSQSGIACTKLLLPCTGPGAVAGDLCQVTPKSCRDTPNIMCNAADYAGLAVPFGDLPGAGKTLALSLARAIPYSGGGTPTGPAATAALSQLHARAAAHPERKQILVLVTDGIPTSCGDDALATVRTLLAGAQMGTPSIPTYAIGVFGPDDAATGRTALNQWAMAGGSGMPFVLDTSDDLTKQLQDALDQIRGAALPCEYMIPAAPPSGTLDYMKVNVHVTGPATGPMGADLGYVANAQACDPAKGGWYYDVDPATGTPTRVIMCETSCKSLKTQVGAKIDLRFGCKTIVIQ